MVSELEYNHMDEMGFSEDKQLMCGATGFLSSANSMKRMCDRFIRNGGRLFDILTAYDSILSYGLNRDDRRSGDAIRTLVPLLKAAGVTDSSLYDHFSKNMDLMPGADVINYMNGLMTVSLVSETYEHHALALCDSLKIPSDMVQSTEVSFDELELDRNEAKKFREYAADISKMDIPKVSSGDGIQFIDHKDQMILDTVDGIIEKMNETDFNYRMEEVKLMGGNEKAFALMDMRRRTMVDLDCTAYIGSNATDYPAMDIIYDNEGLALSFNGDAYAVKGANVAVMSPDPIVAAVLISEFYTEGLEGVYSMIDSWDRKRLSDREHSDRHLMSAMLRKFPSKLPDVVIVDEDNLDRVTRESERFRRKLTF